MKDALNIIEGKETDPVVAGYMAILLAVIGQHFGTAGVAALLV